MKGKEERKTKGVLLSEMIMRASHNHMDGGNAVSRPCGGPCDRPHVGPHVGPCDEPHVRPHVSNSDLVGTS